ncbi:MAG TPA: hypothetical protein VLH15_11645, partial [Dehalococcoidales bacterium]|nr:hypothetical protein [Dehalococcoidales bacterium]
MIKETLTREERFMTAVKLDIPDRVPVSSMFDEFALRQKGITHQQRFDPACQPLILNTFHQIFDDLGGYDIQWHAGTGFPFSSWKSCCDIRINSVPQGSESTLQAERESLLADDYDKIINLGWNGFCQELYPRLTGMSINQLDDNQKKALAKYMEDVQWWKARGVPVHMGATVMNPEVILSLGRTLPKFTIEMHRQPDKILAVINAMVDDLVQNAIADARAMEIPWAHILLTRGSGTFYNLRIFEKFIFPSLKKMVNAFSTQGLYVNLHCDTNWIINLPYFKEFPAGKCVIELDGTTDIIKAKEILRGHICI